MKIFAAVAMLCLLSSASCAPEEEVVTELGVSIRTSHADAAAGSAFLDIRCAGQWQLSLEFEEDTEPWATLSVYFGEGDKKNAYLSWEANPADVARTLRIVLAYDGETAECLFTQQAKGVNPDPDPVPDRVEVDVTKMNWMELPAMDDPSLSYYTHSFDMNGKRYRNYSFGWSQKDLVAVWVAYPLCRFYTNGSVGRTEAWALDPHLDDRSSAPFGGYGDNYDRGHQLPSADRQCCYQANAQTYYGTNMTPQEPMLNQKGWATFEGNVRNWANASDTAYVVTGCIVDKPKGYTTDSFGKEMTVPSAYFKAVLLYSKSSTFSQWSAAAFYYEHKPYYGGLTKNHSMSIDALEEMTGIDFFVNLKDKLGETEAARIEAQDPRNSNVWW